MRFTVHDSPDYYQLKVSVFNDDKKTDLIGETWVNLQEVVIPGGGQSDIWHSLNCKGKYAGEIRIEITYYDTRPKQEKAVKEVKQTNTNAADDGLAESTKGPRQQQQKSPVKRRPLPSDPVTGAPPPAPISTPTTAPIPAPEQTLPRGYSQSAPFSEHVQAPLRGYSAPNAIPAHVQTPPRGYQSPGYIPTQSPLQSVEYNIPQAQYYTQPEQKYSQPEPSYNQPEPKYSQPEPKYSQPEPKYNQPEPRYSQPESKYNQTESNYSQPEPKYNQIEPKYSQPEPKYSQPEPRYNQPERQYSQHNSHDDSNGHGEFGTAPRAITPSPDSHLEDRYGYESRRDDYHNGDGMKRYGDEEEHDSYQFDSRHSPYELPPPEQFGSPPSPGGPPPPPPVHRSRHGSAQPSPAPQHPSHGSFSSRERPHYGVPQHDGHRHSMPDYESQQYKPYRSPTRDDHPPVSPREDYRESPPRHHSYDSRYDHQDYNSMQPTVEDAPPSPSGRDFTASPSYRGAGGAGSRDQQYDERRYDKVPSPAPLNLGGRGSANSGHNSASTTPSHQYSNSSMNYGSSISQLSYRDRANTDTTLSSRTSYNPINPQAQIPRRLSENPSASDYNMPPVPASLVAGMDPAIAQEITDRIYDEKRANFRNSANSPRAYQDSPQYQQTKPHPLSYQEPANPQYGSSPVPMYDDRPDRYATASTAIVKPRAISPDPRRPIRKSVSPSPGPPPGEDTRRLSGVPFGPDSYNAFNPAIGNSASSTSLSAKYDTKESDPDAKIITHDGREIDPSDHIPETNWAPLLESKAPKYASQLPDRNYQPPPTTTPQTASGRRPLRVAARPQSMAASSPIYSHQDPSTPPTGRNRLQKKSNRISAQPAPYSSPLAPITPYQDNSYTPRSQNRGNDYSARENHAPQYGGSPGYRGLNAPPIPAKVPIQNAGLPSQQAPGNSDPWALLEEMKNIDLGSGRARRRQY